MAGLGLPAKVRQPESFQRHGLDAASEGFRRLTQQLGCGAAEDKKTRRERLAVGQHPEEGKQIRPPLDLVNDHEALERAQCGIRLTEPGQGGGIFQVEIIRRVRRDELTGQRGFAALARPQQGDHPAAAQGGADQPPVVVSVDHTGNRYHEIPAVNVGYSWCYR